MMHYEVKSSVNFVFFLLMIFREETVSCKRFSKFKSGLICTDDTECLGH
jgi:hypothetical protein